MPTLSARFAATRRGARARRSTKDGDARETLCYAFADTSVGRFFAVQSEKGLVALRMAPDGDGRAVAEFRKQFQDAELVEDRSLACLITDAVDCYLVGKPTPSLKLDLRGTPFQLRVWQEMQRIPHGQTITYTELARRAGKPRAVRAAGTACGQNPVGILVPCHRVVAKDGKLGGYYWGLDVKERLLEIEAGQS